jgi:transposase
MNNQFFTEPTDDMHRKYEALRSSYVDGLTDQEVAKKFGFSYFSFKTIKRDLKEIRPDYFFKPIQAGRPKGLSEKSLSAKDRIIELRKKNYSVIEIKEKLLLEKVELSENQICKILDQEGFTKLFRRTFAERLEALQKDTTYPEKSDIKDFPLHGEFLTNFGGIFLFLPLLQQLKIPELFNNERFYGSSVIPRQNYLLSYLALKLLGKERLSHVDDLGFDIGLGIFAGLNVLPKSTAMSSYSYRNTPDIIKTMLIGFNKTLYTNGFIKGKNINLDFHSIPFYGEDPTKETNWIPVRNKRMDSI